ncbi:MAG TPA: aromatic acid exporter family protein [Pseudogracilibacillus sp.]|nr:aromatic acid exporter family protein [Pseudogracilibacillus sp.]
MKIGYRTIKTAIATPLSLAIAQFFGVSNVATAGILTMLCIQPSRKKSVETATHRFLACLLAILFSVVFFETLGYSAFILTLLLIVFIPSTIFLKIEKGIMTSTVITLNIYTFEKVNTAFIYNQLWLIVIGIGTGLVINLYMPSLDKKMRAKQHEIEEQFTSILHELAKFIREESMDWDGKEITILDELFEEADDLVERDKENHLLRDKHSYFNYFEMRKEQYLLLQQMMPLVTRLPKKEDIAEDVAKFFEELATAVHPGNTADVFLEELKALRKKFKQEDLPETLEEFETRSSLFQLLFEIEEYLVLKSKFKKSDINKRQKKGKTTK